MSRNCTPLVKFLKVQRISHNLPPFNKKVVCFILAVLTFAAGITGGFFSPKTAYAASSDFVADYLTFSDGSTSTWDESKVNAWTPNTYLTTAVPGTNFYRVTYTLNSSVNSGDVYQVELIDTLRYAYPYWSGVSNIKLYDPNGHWSMIITPDELRDTDVTNSYGDPYKYYPYVVNADLNGSSNGSLQLCVQINLNGTTSSFDFRFTYKAKLSCSYDTESGSLLNSIIEYIKEIFNSLKELPNKIQSFFTDLKDNISAWFDDVGNWFVELGDKIKGFFSELSDNISGFFEKLWNKIWWGNENGESEYEPPTFSSGLTEILDKIDEYITSLEDTQTEIDNAKNNIVGYVEQGTSVINSVFGVFPTALTALVLFAIAFLFARKVVGR